MPRDYEQYVRCKICGAVGNWPEFINKGQCHRDLQKELISLIKLMDISVVINVLNKLPKKKKELIDKFKR